MVLHPGVGGGDYGVWTGRAAVAVPLEIYAPARRAELLLSNAVDAKDYARALKAVRKMGLDPVTIPHRKPAGA